MPGVRVGCGLRPGGKRGLGWLRICGELGLVGGPVSVRSLAAALTARQAAIERLRGQAADSGRMGVVPDALDGALLEQVRRLREARVVGRPALRYLS